MNINISQPLIGREEIEGVVATLKSGFIAQGKRVEKFEKNFARHVGAKYAVATCNGTTALYLFLLAHGIGEGDEVITTPFTFISTVNSILMVGAKPVFVDINESFNIDPEKIEKKITKKTKAIMPVHLFGLSADIVQINQITKKHNLVVIEDAAQAHGAKDSSGRKIGSRNTCMFSFYATKNITSAEGGMVTTNSKKVRDKIRLLRNHGFAGAYKHNTLGYNFRMTDIQAAIGIEQLKKLIKFNKARIKNAKYFIEKLRDVEGLILPLYTKGHVYHQLTIRVTPTFKTSRDELSQKLYKRGVGTKVFYPIPVHKQGLYKKLGYNDSLPVSEKICKEVLSVPVHPSLTRKSLAYIVKSIREISD